MKDILTSILEEIKNLSETHFKGVDFKVDLNKAKEEIQECIENPTEEEFADILIAVLNGYRKVYGTNGLLLEKAILRKVKKNLYRNWKQNENGTYSHIK